MTSKVKIQKMQSLFNSKAEEWREESEAYQQVCNLLIPETIVFDYRKWMADNGIRCV